MDIFILFVLILINGVFAMSELAVVSSRKVRLQQLAEDGDKGAKMALHLAEHPTRFLSTIQVGITSIGILSGVFGEAAIAQKLAQFLSQFSSLALYAKPLSVGVMVLIITFLSLIFGELVPKRLAMHNPELLARLVSRPMYYLSKITAPVVKILSLTTDSILKLLGSRKTKEPSITEEEIKVLMEQGADEGIFDRAEQELVENIFLLDDRKVVSIMTPRKDIVWLDLEDDLASNYEILQQHPYSRFPVCKGSSDQIVGFIDTKHLLDHLLANKAVNFEALIKPPLYLPASVSLTQLLEQFKLNRTHIGLVVDEYGDLDGLVTLNDVMESIVGDIPEEIEQDDEIVKREDGSYLIDGMISLEDFRDYFQIDTPMPGEETGKIHTLGGMAMYLLGRVPSVADQFTWNEFQFEVMDMDKTRVDKVLVSRLDNVNPAPIDSQT